MNIFNGFDSVKGIKNPVVTTGSFDGVHIGHKTILNRLKNLAEKIDGESVLITFDPHPRKVLYPETTGRDLKLICSRDEKLELLNKTGLKNVIIVEFTKEFSKITSEQFVKDYLHGLLNARIVVAGFNHHFGFNKEGDYRHLWTWQEKYSFKAVEIPEQEVYHETVSSTKIRQAISEGYIQRANAYLDDYYLIMGKPQAYKSPGNSKFQNLARIPMTEECKLLPPPGLYAVTVQSGPLHSKGMVIIHMKGRDESEVLIDVFDEIPLLPWQNISVFFHKKIHGAVDLNSETALMKIKSAKGEISELIF
jgi:riboflavin kinase/FMN adenylyltransferase